MGSRNERPRQGDPLALTPRELSGPSLEQSLDAEQTRGPFHLLGALLGVHTLCLEWEGDVVGHGHVGVQRIGLEDHGDTTSAGWKTADVLASEQDLSLSRLLQTHDHPEQGGLAASRRPEEDEELALLGLEIDAVDSCHVAELLAQAADLYDSHDDAPRRWFIRFRPGRVPASRRRWR